MVRKRNSKYPSVLTWKEVCDIRKLRNDDSGIWTYRKLAKEFGISKSQIAKIVTKQSWKIDPSYETLF